MINDKIQAGLGFHRLNLKFPSQITQQVRKTERKRKAENRKEGKVTGKRTT